MRPASSVTAADDSTGADRSKRMTYSGQPGVPLRGDREAGPPVQPSILFLRSEDAARARHATEPVFFTDLNLDQITDSVTMGRREYDLRPFLHTPLHHPEAVRYRHGVFGDLEGARSSA